MKIAFITFEYPPFVQGGAGTYACNFTKELAKLGHEVHVVTPRVAGCARESVADGISIHRLSFLNKPFLAALSFWFSLWRDFSSLEKQTGGFDIVHDNGLSGFSLGQNAVSCPRVVTIHHLARTSLEAIDASLLDRVRNPRGEIGISPFIELPCMRRADRIIAVSESTKQDIIKSYGLPESRIEVIYHGVHCEDYVFPEEESNRLRATLGINQEPMILFVGRLESRKGVDVLLNALPRVLEKVEAKLILVGSGNQRDYQQMAQSLRVADKVEFLGHVPDDTLRLLYSSCDLFVLPSRLEGLGIVLLEAMAAGKPIVATKAGGIPEIVKTGQNGILVDSEDDNTLAQAIIKFLTDSAFARSVSENNASLARSHYSWQNTAKKTEQLYRIILDQR